MHAANVRIQSLEADLQRITETHARHNNSSESESKPKKAKGVTFQNTNKSTKTDDRLGRLEACLENMMQLHEATAIPKKERKKIVCKLSNIN